MSGLEHKQSQDDSEIEITDIDERDSADAGASTSTRSSRSLLQPRFSPCQRRLQLTITASIVVLALLVILGNITSLRNLAGGVFGPTPTPTQTLVPGVDLFYIGGSPSWGRLSIDGQAVSHLPIIGSDAPLRLPRGHHLLLWRADPFQPQYCIVSVPPSYATDTCSYNQTVQLESGLSAWVVTFSVSLNTLSDSQRTAVIQAAQAALDAQQSTDIVRPGERYALASACREPPRFPRCFATANQPLKAILSFHLDTDVISNKSCAGPQPGCTLIYQNCHLFCDGGFTQSSSPATQEWDVVAAVRPVWEFTTLDGRVLARDQSDNAAWDYATGDIEDEYLVPLQITWTSGGWHAMAMLTKPGSLGGPFDNPVCALVQNEVNLLGDAVLNNISIPLQWQFASGTVLAAGCVAVASPATEPGITPTPSTSPPLMAYCLYRFGVLLAANDEAHRLWPYLPVADAYEQGIARRLTANMK